MRKRRIYALVVLLLAVVVFATAGSVVFAQSEKGGSELDVNLSGGVPSEPVQETAVGTSGGTPVRKSGVTPADRRTNSVASPETQLQGGERREDSSLAETQPPAQQTVIEPTPILQYYERQGAAADPARGIRDPRDTDGDGTVSPAEEAAASNLGKSADVFTIPGFLTRAEGILNLIIPFLIGLAVFMILWGIFLYVTKAAEEEKRAEARLYIVWGIVAVFSMLSLWGFVNILVNSFNLETTIDASKIPTAPTL